MKEKAQELLQGRSMIFALNQGKVANPDPDVFRQFVELAVEYGATHIDVGTLPYRYTWFLPDNHDPYAAWCNDRPGVLRVFPPEELHEWVPLEAAQELQEAIAEKLEIMRPYGLKGVAGGVEPLWLPEGVYRAHPRWRGAQCELGRIARRPYFAPSIDEPEVLDLYRRSLRLWAERFPEIDQYTFMSNDSGGGIAWAPNVYPGMNGPVRYRQRDPGQRIAGWLEAMQEGAAEAGCSIRVNLHSSGLPPGLVASTRAKLGSGLFINWGNEHGESWRGAGASLGSGIWGAAHPAEGMANPMAFAGGLQAAYHNPDGDDNRVSISIDQPNLDLARTLLASFFEDPGKGRLNRLQTLLRAAEQVCGQADLAEGLLGVWETVQQAMQVVAQVRQPGFGLVLPFCCTSMRWLTRPLVPEPEDLTPEETAYYRDFVFTTGTDEQNQNLCYVLGKPVFRGHSAMWMARWCLNDAIGRLRGARGSLEGLAERANDTAAAAGLRLEAARIGAFGCLAANAKNTIMYQHALDIRQQPQFGPNPMDYDDNIVYDQRALQLRKIAREELDNITELVELIESQTEAVIAIAPTAEEENVFLFGPNLLTALKHKMTVMLDHWQDYERLYPATKVWEFEAEPEDNIVQPE